MSDAWDAAKSGDVEELRRLLDEGFNFNQGDYDYRTPLHLAASEGHLNVVQFLVEHANVDVAVSDRFGHTPLQDAVHNVHDDICDYLRPKMSKKSAAFPDRAEFDTSSQSASLALDAAAKGDLKSLEEMLERGCPMDESDYDMRTPLHLAAAEGHLETVTWLIKEAGVDAKARDRWNQTAMQEASRNGHRDVVAFLRQYTAPKQPSSSGGITRRKRPSGGGAAPSGAPVPRLSRSGTIMSLEERKSKVGEPTEEEVQSEKKYLMIETIVFFIAIMLVEVVIIVLMSVWLDYLHEDEAEEDVDHLFDNFKDVSVMIFFGFGFLMTFLRRHGFSAIGYTLLISSVVVQWSVILEHFFFELHEDADFDEVRHFGIETLLNGLFCSGAVMISFGAILGKATPLQLLILGLIEPFFYWLNFYINALELEVIDVGGGYYIHMFGAYFGLAVTWFLTSKKSKGHEDNCSCYSSDIFSLAGTLFLWLYWPTFNAIVASAGIGQLRAIINTFLSLCGATVASFALSRLVEGNKFDPVHIQNSTLAGGVMMGIAGDLDLHPAGAIGCGIVSGLVSVLGYKYLTPLMNRYLGIQDICGVHNLHGMPAIMAAIISIFATLGISQRGDEDEFPHTVYQPLYQLAALGITLGLAIASGIITGVILYAATFIHPIQARDFFNDRTFWVLPSDYEHVVRDDAEQEMSDMSG